MKSAGMYALASFALVLAQNVTVRPCTQDDISSANGAWTSDAGVKCFKGLGGISLADLAKGRVKADVLAKGDKNEDCLEALNLQDNIIDLIASKSGDCSITADLTLYDTTFHEEKGYLTGWANALKNLKDIDGSKADATLLKEAINEALPDCSQDDFNLVDAAWATDEGASCLSTLGISLGDFSKGTASADALAAAASNADCATVLDYQGQIIDYIVSASGDCKVTADLTLYQLSLKTLTEWAAVVKGLKDIDLSKPTATPPIFAEKRAATLSSADNSTTNSGNSTGGATPTTTKPSSATTFAFSLASLAVALVVV